MKKFKLSIEYENLWELILAALILAATLISKFCGWF